MRNFLFLLSFVVLFSTAVSAQDAEQVVFLESLRAEEKALASVSQNAHDMLWRGEVDLALAVFEQISPNTSYNPHNVYVGDAKRWAGIIKAVYKEDYESALPYFESVRDTFAQYMDMKRSRANELYLMTGKQANYTQSLFYVGYVHYRQGNLQVAKDIFERMIQNKWDAEGPVKIYKHEWNDCFVPRLPTVPDMGPEPLMDQDYEIKYTKDVIRIFLYSIDCKEGKK